MVPSPLPGGKSLPRSAARRPNPADLQNRVDQLKEQGEKVAVLLVSNADAETRFVALSLQQREGERRISASTQEYLAAAASS